MRGSVSSILQFVDPIGQVDTYQPGIAYKLCENFQTTHSYDISHQYIKNDVENLSTVGVDKFSTFLG